MTRLGIASFLVIILLAAALTFSTALAQSSEPPVVHAIMFWMSGCPHCEYVLEEVLPPLQDKHGAQLQIFLIEVESANDVDALVQLAAFSYGISSDRVGVPFLIIGEHVLIGSGQIPAELPALIEQYLAQGGVEIDDSLGYLIPTATASPSTSGLPAAAEAPLLADTVPTSENAVRDNGFTLAIVTMIGMAVVMLYSMFAFIAGKSFHLPNWADWLLPVLIALGFGVAAYLSYVETQSVEAICGPVGDCNTVQQSRFATLFGFLPVGVLGLLGYLGLIAAWLTRKYLPKFAKPADIAFFGMAFFAVIFSLYLTYLELFVIRAVCIWCLTSAVIVTLLLLLGTPPAILRFSVSDEEE